MSFEYTTDSTLTNRPGHRPEAIPELRGRRARTDVNRALRGDYARTYVTPELRGTFAR